MLRVESTQNHVDSIIRNSKDYIVNISVKKNSNAKSKLFSTVASRSWRTISTIIRDSEEPIGVPKVCKTGY